MMDHPSTEKIQPFIEDFNIDMNVFQNRVQSFNDFFTRK
jgi:phosphatidylserine decarboxylase